MRGRPGGVGVAGRAPGCRALQSRCGLFLRHPLPCAREVLPAPRPAPSALTETLAFEGMAARSPPRPACTARQLLLGCVFIASVTAHPCFSYCSFLDASYRCACDQQHFLREAFAVQQRSNRAVVNANTHVLVVRVFPSLFKPGNPSLLTQFSSNFQQSNLVNVSCIFIPRYIFSINEKKIILQITRIILSYSHGIREWFGLEGILNVI